jgi:hypothetical protein
VTDCIFENNYGNGIYNYFSNPTIENCYFCGNQPYHINGDLDNWPGNTFVDVCPSDCPDINGDGYVNVTDLLVVIDQWGLTNSPADVNFDGIVDVSDLLIVVGNWGECE